MNSKTIILVIAGLLLLIGITKPDLSSILKTNQQTPCITIEDTDFSAPNSEILKEKAKDIIKALSVDSDRKIDGKRLASLYNDIAALIALDGDSQVIKNTEEVRQANRLSGLMLKLNIKDKYENLAEANQALIKEAIGDDVVLLDSKLRSQAVEAFKTLAWACNEGSK
jgi:hypothetical protein